MNLTDRRIKEAMAAFGVQVKEQAEGRQEMVMTKLREEIERIRPHAERLLNGKIN